MSKVPERFIAVDWSGDKTASGQRRKIWIADWHGGSLSLESGRNREEVCEFLIAAPDETPRLVAGLDFAFSYPAWFVREQGCDNAETFWELVAGGKGEEWLSAPNAFCWGRTGCRCPGDHRAPEWRGFRKTDREISVAGIQPKSPFQTGGAGAVGTGSLRGIPVLHRLRQAGFSIWPFTEPGFPVALEIYPRLFTGPGNKSSCEFRARHLAQSNYASLPEEVLTKARNSEDAFDALCSVLGMTDHAEEFSRLEQATDPSILLEGQIWEPSQSPKISPS